MLVTAKNGTACFMFALVTVLAGIIHLAASRLIINGSPNCCKIAITLKMHEKGEWKAQACAIACYNNCE